MNWDVWGPPLVVLVLGTIAGLVVVMRSMAGTSAGGRSAAGLTLDDLQTRKDALVEELRGLEAEHGKMSEDAFSSRWQDTLTRAAVALRELDHFSEVPVDTEEVAREIEASVDGVTFGRVGWIAAVVVFFVVLGLTLSEATKPRDAGASLTGSTVDPSKAALEAFEARLAKDPSDIEAASELAHAAIRDGDLEAGMKYVDAGRKVAPDDPRIQASLAALMLAIGYNDRAETMLDTVLAEDPKQARAWLWRGVLYATAGDSAKAVDAFQKVLELSTDSEDRRLAAGMLVGAQNPTAVSPQGGSGGMGPATAPQAAGQQAAASSAPRVSGHVSVAAGSVVPDGALVFIYARRAVNGRGPPVAALKLPASSLPLDFQLGDGDIVMGDMTWPDQVWLSARIDTDGNAMTHDAGAPVSQPVGPVASLEPVELVLQ